MKEGHECPRPEHRGDALVLGRRRRRCQRRPTGRKPVCKALVVLAGNTLLRPLVNTINRSPIDESQTEATYEIRVTVPAERQDQAREAHRRLLDKAHYPARGRCD